MILFFPDLDFFSENDIEAIVAPSNIYLKIATEQYEIPYIVTSLRESNISQSKYLFHILPQPADIAYLVHKLLKTYDWANVAMIYDDTIGKSTDCHTEN